MRGSMKGLAVTIVQEKIFFLELHLSTNLSRSFSLYLFNLFNHSVR